MTVSILSLNAQVIIRRAVTHLYIYKLSQQINEGKKTKVQIIELRMQEKISNDVSSEKIIQ